MFPADETGDLRQWQVASGKEELANAKDEAQPDQSAHIEESGLTNEEKVVLNLQKDNSPIDLNALKEQAGPSNKKWDKAIKGLTKNHIAMGEKIDEELFVELA